MKYQVYGMDLKVGALGTVQHFSLTTEASGSDQARQNIRDRRYKAGYEHVTILEVREI